MYIRFYNNDDDDFNEARFIHSIDLKDNYSEYIKTMKIVDGISIDGYFYNLDFISVKPAESDEFISSVDVYVKTP